MKPLNFFLSPVLYALGAVGLAVEALLFFPDSLRRQLAESSFSNISMLAADGAVLLVIALVLTAVVSIRDGLVVLRIGGFPFSKTPIAEIATISSSFPFLTVQRGAVGQSKPRFLPAMRSKQQFLDALREQNPNIQLETGKS